MLGQPPSTPRLFPGSCFLPLPRAGVHADSHHGTAQPSLSPVLLLGFAIPRGPSTRLTPHGGKAPHTTHAPGASRRGGGRCQACLPGHTAAASSASLHPYPGTAPPWGVRAGGPALGHSPNPGWSWRVPSPAGTPSLSLPSVQPPPLLCTAAKPPLLGPGCGQEEPSGYRPSITSHPPQPLQLLTQHKHLHFSLEHPAGRDTRQHQETTTDER